MHRTRSKIHGMLLQVAVFSPPPLTAATCDNIPRAKTCTTGSACDVSGSVQPLILIPGATAPARGLISTRPTCIGPRQAFVQILVFRRGMRDHSRCFTLCRLPGSLACQHVLRANPTFSIIWRNPKCTITVREPCCTIKDSSSTVLCNL